MSLNQLKPKIFACTQSVELAEKIAKEYGAELGKVTTTHFSDGEFQPAFEESIRGRRIFIIGSTFPNSDNLMEMLLMIDAAKRASARHVTAVIPYFGWARQDRKDKPRVAIGAKLVANLLQAAGATRIMTMDLHADQIQGFFEKPVDHLFASTIFLPYVKSLELDNLTIASPDMGGSKRAYAYSKYLNSDVVICYKQRKKANVISHMELIGDVKGQNVILVDDIVDTAGTLCRAADIIMEKGAKKKKITQSNEKKNQMVKQAEKEAIDWGDDYISTEHFALAMLKSKKSEIHSSEPLKEAIIDRQLKIGIT